MKTSLMPKNTTVDSQPSKASADNDKRFTGRKIVVLDQSARSTMVERKAGTVSLRMANIRDYSSSISGSTAIGKALTEADGIVFDKLKVAVINEDHTEQIQKLTISSKTRNVFLSSEPERFVYALAKKKARSSLDDDVIATWGIHAVNVLNSDLTGKRVRLAILDTGLSLKHPDFKNRVIRSKSFIRGLTAEDGNGHGSHCTGIAAGNISIEKNFRYGVASRAHIYAGKVLNDDGEGEDNTVLAGIEWALENKCRVISMSLGSSVLPGESFYTSYEVVAQRAAQQGCLIIAAAGNDSERRRGIIKPVNHPANCPSIMAVAAIDKKLKIADFSCAGTRAKGSNIDIAAPGVEIFSASIKATHEILSGTSMATPFVAGMAALLWEENPRAQASVIWKKLIQGAKRLKLKKSDVGSGLVFI